MDLKSIHSDPSVALALRSALDSAMTVGRGGGPTATGGPGPVEHDPSLVPECMSLSPDALLAYCQSRLNSLDSQMTTAMDTQQKSAEVTEAINKVAAALNDLPGPDDNTPPKVAVDDKDRMAVINAYQNAIDTAGRKSATGQSLYNDMVAFEEHIDKKNNNISSDELSQLAQNAKNDGTSLNNDAELTMISLQSLISQRATAIQLTTNLVQALGEQTSDITKNIGQG